MALPRKYRYPDLIALGEGGTRRVIQSRIAKGQFPPPDLHDAVDGDAIWYETTVATHRERGHLVRVVGLVRERPRPVAGHAVRVTLRRRAP